MNVLNKWNWEKKEYDKYYVPKEWVMILFSNDMEVKVNCAQCGKVLEYGQCYTSLEVHNNHGFGFGVCEECYKCEHERRRKSELVKKETPMEVNMEDYELEDEYQYPIYSCPKCGKHINDEDNYCRHCGQRLEWKDDE